MRLLVLCLVAVVLPNWALAEEKLTARQILDKVDDLYRGDSAQGEMGMKVVTEHWTREMKMSYLSKGKKKFLARILLPRKEKGTATLKVDNKIWNYLPKTNRIIKIPSSMMGGSWMGSHFTNDDIVKEGRMADDYHFSKSFEGKKDGVEVIEIDCVPKPDVAVVWGKITVRVRKSDYQPLIQYFYNEDEELARTMVFSDFKKMDDRLIPTKMKIVPVDKPNEYTEVTLAKVKYNVDISDNEFSLRSLQK